MTAAQDHIQNLFDKNYDARKRKRLCAVSKPADKFTEGHKELYRELMTGKESWQTPNAFVSLAPNIALPKQAFIANLKELYSTMQRYTFGNDWQKFDKIAPAWFAIEHEETNIHAHALWRITPAHLKVFEFKCWKVAVDGENMHSDLMCRLWRAVTPAGTIRIRRIEKNGLSGAQDYLMKDFQRVEHARSNLLSLPDLDTD